MNHIKMDSRRLVLLILNHPSLSRNAQQSAGHARLTIELNSVFDYNRPALNVEPYMQNCPPPPRACQRVKTAHIPRLLPQSVKLRR
jgi:hypothetical protein